jgi:glutamine synthetase
MNNLRFQALQQSQNRTIEFDYYSSDKISDIFGSMVFSQKEMKHYLSKDTVKQLNKAIISGEQISRKIADDVASGMKNWAMSKGASHYTHWFQPLTGATAEKHDAFFELKDGDPIESFSAGALVQQEPDASSFPNGGIRSTFEARGYTAWDPSSPAFIMRSPNGATVCIPTIFISYTGEALDYKSPLLKTLHVLEKAAEEVCRYFDESVKKVNPTLGIEQEYFLIDEAMYYARPDLMLTGRTLFGHTPAKGQQMEDHYWGSIPERINAYMIDFEQEAYRLGIPLKTRHNEVAPGQYECAPQFEEVNIAVDHNQLLMDIMEKVARRHKFKAILHEKPFAGVNGSGKHCNWSMSTDTGVNLLSPGTDPVENLQFLTFFINTIKAVNDYADLMRASIASASNDHRLGANEAPPAIMSVFIGETLTNVLNELVKTNKSARGKKAAKVEDVNFNIPKIPEILLDNTDRNRTSPFAFTGNKFEFRAVGSSFNTASAMIVLNIIVANQLKIFKKEVDAQIYNGIVKDEAILSLLKQYVKESKSILFEGNNYSDDWVKEAKKRGLSNIKSTPDALGAYVTKNALSLFEENQVMTHREVEARYEIQLEIYAKQIQIESRVIGEMALSQVLPAAIDFQNKLLLNYTQMAEIGLKEEAEKSKEYIQRIANHINLLRSNVFDMIEERRTANKMESAKDIAKAYCDKVKPYFEVIRYHIDKLELYVDDREWPFPKYREMLFIK